MSDQPTTKVWFVNGQLLTNNPAAFAKAFDIPNAAPVDGLSRVSHRLGKPKPTRKAKKGGTSR